MKEVLNAPIVIIGAPRSGTNMLRDALNKIPTLGTWPCDEINYIWRHQNAKIQHDEFAADLATPQVQKFIRKEFISIAKSQKCDRVIEKTCANSLRVGFVDNVLPEAVYVYIYRDGRDAALSASKRWKAELDIKYILAKAKYIPLTDIPFYMFKYFYNRVYKIINREERLAFWGPKFIGVDEAVKSMTLIELCAMQWRKCIDNTERDFKNISKERVIRIKYEDFVEKPAELLASILDQLNVKYSDENVQTATKGIFKESVGKWKKELNEEQISKLHAIVEMPLNNLGYSI